MSEIAEAENARLQPAREVLEHEKLALETAALRRANGWVARATDMLKSAVVVVGGIITLGIGYNLTDLKNEKLKQEIVTNQAALTRLKHEQRALEKKNADYKDAIASAAQQVRQVTESTGAAMKQLDALQQTVAAGSTSGAGLRAVSTEVSKLQRNFAVIDATAGDANVGLQTAKPTVLRAPTAGVAPLATQVAELFAPTAGRRGAAYQALMTYYATDPALVPALLARAQAEPNNLNGLYNALVVLGELKPLPPGTDMEAVRQFALASRGKGARIAGRVEKVLTRQHLAAK
ncbi:hypothetical protein [Hymenobacter daeguensis]